jgi:flagellar biosynthesis/type III secretory pathway protein FliH
MNHINKPTGFNPMANSHHPQFSKHNHVSNSPESQESKTRENVSISDKSVVALKMVHQSISSKFLSMKDFEGKVEEAHNALVNSFDFEAVAKNVMSFVNSSLNAAQSRGASTSELEEMLGQARQGANNGIDEAIDELSGLNVLDEELSEGIEKARTLINAGLDETEEKIINSLSPPVNSPSLTSQAVEYSSNKYNSQSNSSDLSIKTADGDIVTISFSALEASQSSENFGYYADQGSNEMNYQRSSSSYSEMNFSYSVEGDLDKEELQAIQSLIEDISKIEKDFFAGNINDAFNKAVELGYDEEQLSSFSLELRQTQTNYVSQAYSEVANYNEEANDELTSTVKPVLDFIGDFKELQEQAKKILNEEGDQFSKLLESVLNSEFDNNQKLLAQFNKFVEKLM